MRRPPTWPPTKAPIGISEPTLGINIDWRLKTKISKARRQVLIVIGSHPTWFWDWQGEAPFLEFFFLVIISIFFYTSIKKSFLKTWPLQASEEEEEQDLSSWWRFPSPSFLIWNMVGMALTDEKDVNNLDDGEDWRWRWWQSHPFFPNKKSHPWFSPLRYLTISPMVAANAAKHWGP